MDERRHTNIILEQLQSTLQTVLEYVKEIPGMQRDITDLRQHAEQTNSRLSSLELIAKQHSAVLLDQESRLQ